MKLDRAKRWIEEYQRRGALWIHDGNYKRPHALLTSGKHSDGFFNSGLVAEDPSLVIEAGRELAGAVADRYFDMSQISCVAGPALGAIVLAHCLADALNAAKYTERRCRAVFTEKDDSTGGMILRRSTLSDDDVVLVVEDVLTTGGSSEKTVNAVRAAGGQVVPYVAVLVNRSGLSTVAGGAEVVALVDRAMSTWSPDECPLCEHGSEAVRPKGYENWVRLNADY